METTTADPSARAATRPAVTAKVLVLAGAVAVALGGILHLRTWNSDYRTIPDGAVPGLWVVKTGFPLNAAVSIVLAALLVAIAFRALGAFRLPILGAALLVQVGSIAAMVASRGPGIFGWKEAGYEGDAIQILVVEVVGCVLLIAALLLELADRRRNP